MLAVPAESLSSLLHAAAKSNRVAVRIVAMDFIMFFSLIFYIYQATNFTKNQLLRTSKLCCILTQLGIILPDQLSLWETQNSLFNSGLGIRWHKDLLKVSRME